MSKRSHQKRKALQKKKRRPPHRSLAEPPRTAPAVAPSAQTILRSVLLSFQTQEVVSEAVTKADPSLWQRDRKTIEQIENTDRIEEVLDLAPKATGLAEYAWLKRMRRFGPSAAPIIAAHFNTLGLDPKHKDFTVIEEKFVQALRWYESAGIEPLLSCWNGFDDYGRSLASVVLGLLKAQTAADQIWAFYQHVKNNRRENLFVGALWALIDLQDHRAADALLELLMEGHDFYELFGFLARAGDRRAFLSLFALSVRGDEAIKPEAQWAVISLAHRIGRAGVLEELERAFTGLSKAGKTPDEIADQILAQSGDEAREHFSLFYDGVNLPDWLLRQETLH